MCPSPPVEPPPRRRGIDPQPGPESSRMTSRVQQDVCKRVPDLARRAKDPHVEALGEDAPPPSERPVRRPRDACADGHHAAAEGVGIARLDDEMRVRVLQRVVGEAKVSARADGSEALLEPVHERDRSQRRNARKELHGHMGGEAGGERLAAAVGYAGLRPRLAPGTCSSSSPSKTFSKPEIELPSLHRDLNSATFSRTQ